MAVFGTRRLAQAMGVALLSVSANAAGERGAPPQDEKPVQLAEVPPAVLAAARKELGAKPTSARTVSFEGQLAYLLEATNRYDKHLTVVVAADGTILKPVNIWDADDD